MIMAGGGGVGNSQNQTAQALQNYPVVPNSSMGAQASPAGTQPMAQNVSQLQQVLQRMGAQHPGMQSPAMQIANGGMQMAKMGSAPPAMAPPMAHPMGPAAPYQGAMPPQMMTGGMGMGGMPTQGGLPWQALLARRGMM
jgi:hypothetical protein